MADTPELDPTLVPTEADKTLAGPAPAARISYKVGELLGKGGMGEVRAAEDDSSAARSRSSACARPPRRPKK